MGVSDDARWWWQCIFVVYFIILSVFFFLSSEELYGIFFLVLSICILASSEGNFFHFSTSNPFATDRIQIDSFPFLIEPNQQTIHIENCAEIWFWATVLLLPPYFFFRLWCCQARSFRFLVFGRCFATARLERLTLAHFLRQVNTTCNVIRLLYSSLSTYSSSAGCLGIPRNERIWISTRPMTIIWGYWSWKVEYENPNVAVHKETRSSKCHNATQRTVHFLTSRVWDLFPCCLRMIERSQRVVRVAKQPVNSTWQAINAFQHQTSGGSGIRKRDDKVRKKLGKNLMEEIVLKSKRNLFSDSSMGIAIHRRNNPYGRSCR